MACCEKAEKVQQQESFPLFTATFYFLCQCTLLFSVHPPTNRSSRDSFNFFQSGNKKSLAFIKLRIGTSLIFTPFSSIKSRRFRFQDAGKQQRLRVINVTFFSFFTRPKKQRVCVSLPFFQQNFSMATNYFDLEPASTFLAIHLPFLSVQTKILSLIEEWEGFFYSIPIAQAKWHSIIPIF